MLAPRWPHSASKVRARIIEALLLAVRRGTCDISVLVIPDSLGGLTPCQTLKNGSSSQCGPIDALNGSPLT